MKDIVTYKTRDLVLDVTTTVDPFILDLDSWTRYLDVLCGDRSYQKEAIRRAVTYLASSRYSTIDDLVSENWNSSDKVQLRERYHNLSDYNNDLQLPGKLWATIDLATGTGKSYVMYGVAQIMLGLALVDKVLVLCPSLTIEQGLKEKFISLSGDAKLYEALPDNIAFRNPGISDANRTIQSGDICVENIHAVYEGNSSSIRDSFIGQGQRTLVLNDEAHHIFNAVSGRDQYSKNMKKWKEFLVGGDYNFRYLLGFTGTAYIDDDYFNDVIYRYSLREAVDDRVVKMVDYVSKDDSLQKDEKFQKILDNHLTNKETYRKVKPITIFVTKDISSARQLTSELVSFLSDALHLPVEIISDKVLLVTSHKEHKVNVLKLRTVDDFDDPVEWIVSVSMLSEGWDVKNVFQIVPWEDRAFNSKLLISQVLGRGLRIPSEYQSPQPRVRVFNHDAWSRNIKGLVDEILEIELRLFSSVLENGERSKYNFVLYNIDYEREQLEKESTKRHEEFDYTKGYIELVAQVEETEKETEYLDLRGRPSSKNTLVHYTTYSVDEIVDKIHDELKTREWEGKLLKLPHGTYSKANLPTRNEIREIVLQSMKRVGIKGDRLVVNNKYKIESAFSTLLRKRGKTIVNVRKVTAPHEIPTQSIDRESLAVGNLRRSSTVFYASNYDEEVYGDNKDILESVVEDETFLKSSSKEINPYLFKTPLDIVFTKSEPERRFVELLCKRDNAPQVSSWIKSRDQGFYSVEYTITTTGGKHSKQQSFNPDFFIKVDHEKKSYVIVVEIKSDGDVTGENRAKLRYARQHFENLNLELEKNAVVNQQYIFHFLSPNSYTEFFEYLRNGSLVRGEFRSQLEDELDQISD